MIFRLRHRPAENRTPYVTRLTCPSSPSPPRFQIVIPKDVRRALKLQPGQKLDVRVAGDRMELVPQQPMSAARGMLEGIDTHVPNDPEDWTTPDVT
ncbi:MAG: AbrB/MazE/SpoVT family DNA-binding domain-containing protein [Pseudomonadota bacterium]|nr:AbrB/MazE/SpoVT family DNA-binding domain-containing protein [Pseudomonadota bacterium]